MDPDAAWLLQQQPAHAGPQLQRQLSSPSVSVPSPSRRRWADAPPPVTVGITISPASSPHAGGAWPESPVRNCSPGSPHMFQLSPDVPGLGSLPPGHDVGAGDAASEATDDDGDTLISFLADLKSKYGLLDAMQMPAAGGSPARRQHPQTITASAPASQRPPSRQPAPVQPVSVRVVVRHGSPARGESSQSEAPPPPQQHAPPRSRPSWPAQADNDWLELTEEEKAAAAASMITNPVFDSRQASAAEGSAGATAEAEQQREAEQAQQPAEEQRDDAEMEAELALLEALQRQLDEAQEQSRQQPQSQQPAEQPEPEPEPPAAPPAEQQEEPLSAAAEASGSTSDGPPAQWGPSLPPLQGRRLPWGSLHTLLVQRGFPGLLPPNLDPSSAATADLAGQPPDPAAVFEALHSLLQEQERSAGHQQRLAEAVQAAGRREGAIVASFTSAAKRRDAEVGKWKRLALDNQLAARDAQNSSRASGRSGEAAAAAARRLEGAVDQMQHEVRGKEAELDRLREMLRAHQEQDERRAAADRDAFERLKRAYAASKAADTPGGAAAALKAAAREMKLLDVCRVFEAERANLAEQAAVAAADAAAACARLARAQEAMHAAGLPCEQYDEIEGQARTAARAAAAAEERAAQLAEEASMLRLEVAARPTQAQYDSVKRQVDIMERQLAKAQAQQAEQEQEGGSIKAHNKQPRRQLSTRDMILRDRNMQRLGLSCVEGMPKPVLEEVVQDACALLECKQPLELCAAIRPVQDTAALVPRMERFIGDVCGAVFQRGLAHVPAALRQDNPSDVPTILATWIAELGELLEMRGVLRALLRQLGSRVSVQPNDPSPTAAEVVPLVASLVELERQVYHSREVLEAAETALASQPEVLINRICLQFQRLFGCNSLEGVLPAMNKLYLAHAEAQTFLSSLRAALGLEPGVSLEACANRMEQLLADKRDVLATMLPARPPHAAAPVLPQSAQAVVVEVLPQRGREQELQRAAQVAVERMAARRHWPQVQIYVPAAEGGVGE